MIRCESFVLNWCTNPRYHVKWKILIVLLLPVCPSIPPSRTLWTVTHPPSDRFSPDQVYWNCLRSRMCNRNVTCSSCSSGMSLGSKHLSQKIISIHRVDLLQIKFIWSVLHRGSTTPWTYYFNRSRGGLSYSDPLDIIHILIWKPALVPFESNDLSFPQWDMIRRPKTWQRDTC